ncbi:MULTISPECIES: hypothetical protein [unclassified Cryobacterium]|uniref:hypothetical protein n=1 Tax=unclassified Cryobacterium TaxID=2649013 RepID=UPI002AB33AD9|nr:MULTISPECIES: hypothetical protein [unclassified Cryobacterium]MDY7528154.1 hypothetical protein [Cryobacterium sp. 10C2]MDY7556097.1 hypothetical protein [Cryobacterium sp. 10C3]MEB0289347.1 hypothetical protein [Cryobacterium sp. 10C2]
MKNDLMKTPRKLTIDAVNEMHQILSAEASRGGPAPTVTALAARLGVKRPAFYAAFPDVVTKIAQARQQSGEGPIGRKKDDRAIAAEAQLRVVRRERDDLLLELNIYAEQVRRLTVENETLRRALEGRADIPRIGSS